jgi:hypothetical protein
MVSFFVAAILLQNCYYVVRFYSSSIDAQDEMDNNTIEVTGIPKHLLSLLDERIRQQGGDRAGYIRQLIEKDVLAASHTQKQPVLQGKRQPFDPEKWAADMKALAERADLIPVLPPEAFTRESIYGNHD